MDIDLIYSNISSSIKKLNKYILIYAFYLIIISDKETNLYKNIYYKRFCQIIKTFFLLG